MSINKMYVVICDKCGRRLSPLDYEYGFRTLSEMWSIAELAGWSVHKYGSVLCFDCVRKEK